MTGSSSNGRAPSVIPRVMHLLSDLRQTAAGDAICRHIEEILAAYDDEVSDTRDTGHILLRSLLKAWASRLDPNTPEGVEIRMLQLRLNQPPRRSELDSLERHIHSLIGAPLPEPRPEPQAQAVAPEPDAAPPAPEFDEEIPSAAPPAHDPDEDDVHPVDSDHRRHLSEKRERIQKIQETLARQVGEVIKQNEKFGVLLEVEHETLRQTDNINELEGLKRALVSEVGKLREGHQALSGKLESASKYLQLIETEGQHLNEELTRVHILSLTDELTDLPNRRAFLRRLEDEVARVQRYGYPLSLALIDMDHFKAINDKYGHAAGDEVLRGFSASVLSIFRHHDMVARYGGEEFAVLLPNTDKNGAMRALEKVAKRNAESSYQVDDRSMPMPSFSAGISLYKPGETPGSLIERADKALYQAKRLGRDRVELSQQDMPESMMK